MLHQRPRDIFLHAFTNEIAITLLKLVENEKEVNNISYLKKKVNYPMKWQRWQSYIETIVFLKICYSLLLSLFAAGVMIFCDMHLNCSNFQDFDNLH